ncbi:MAG: hypothetical protein K2H43_02940, partial [Clostridia bacterium]|nr:hypothetical protein [Clostridia bacterium]
MTTLLPTNYQKNAGYDAWKNDKLWLVAQGEIGSSGSPAGLWKTNSAMIGAAANYWERTAASSGNAVNANSAHNQNSSGIAVNTTMNVRPAFHLNLSKAAKSKVETAKVPTIPAQTYNGLEQTFDFTTITGYSADKMKITNIAYDGTLPTGYASPSVVAPDAPATSATKVKFTEAGTYTVTFESLMESGADGSKTQWFFGRNPDKTTDTATLTVNKAKLTTPSFGSGANSTKPFDGSELTFTANNYPNDTVAATNTVAYPRNPLSVSFKEGTAVLSPQPAMTENSNSTLEVKIRDAGNYGAEFTIADPTNYEWADGTSAPKTVNFTVSPIQLKMTSTTTETGNAWSWAADSTSASGTITVSGFYIGDGTSADPADTVNLQLEIKDSAGATNYLTGTDNGDGSYTFTIDQNISIFGGTYATGTYYLKPVLSNGTSGTHDGNYELTTALSGLNGGLGYKLVIGTASAGLPTYTWTYTEDGGSDQAMPTDNKLTYKYNSGTSSGAVYEVTVDTTGFAAAYIAIDTSKYTNGYKNRSASVAGRYVTTLALKTTDSDHTFSLPGGGTSTTSEITFEWEIEKADYDFTNVKWQYTDTEGNTTNYPARWDSVNSVWEYLDTDGNAASADAGIPWYGENYTLTLTGLPTGVTITNPTGAYTGNKEKFISVNGYQAECNGITSDTSNYNALPANLMKLDWKIVKGKVIIRASGSWTTSQQGSDSNIFYVPALQNVSGVEYEYYDLGTTANSPGPGTLLGGLTDVTSVLGTKHYYYVKAVVASGVSSDGVTLWRDAIELVDETNPEPKYGACTKAFETGDNRTPVQITLNGAPYTYDGNEHGVLNDGTNGGELEIKVGGNAFPTSRYDILYYEYDANNSADHYKGTPIPDPPTNAGKYIIEIRLTTTAAQDYYATDEYFEFEIKPYVLDMSQVKWGYLDAEGNEVEYNPASPLEYGLDGDGNPIKHNLILIGLPKGDVNGDLSEQLQAKMYEESGLGNDGSDSTKPQ